MSDYMLEGIITLFCLLVIMVPLFMLGKEFSDETKRRHHALLARQKELEKMQR